MATSSRTGASIDRSEAERRERRAPAARAPAHQRLGQHDDEGEEKKRGRDRRDRRVDRPTHIRPHLHGDRSDGGRADEERHGELVEGNDKREEKTRQHSRQDERKYHSPKTPPWGCAQ